MVSGKIESIKIEPVKIILLILLCCLFIGTPLIIHRAVLNAAINTKFFYSQFLIFIIFILWVIYNLLNYSNWKIRYHPIQIFILIFFFYLFLHGLFHPELLLRWKESLPLFSWLILSLLIPQIIKREKEIRILLISILIGAIISSLHGIGQYFGYEIPYLEWKGKPPIGMYIVIGTLGNANFFAEFLIPVFFLIFCWLYLAVAKKGLRYLGFISLIIIGYGIWLSGANEVWAILPFSILILLFGLGIIYRDKIINFKLSIIINRQFIIMVLILIIIISAGIYIASLSDNWFILKYQYRLIYELSQYIDRFMIWEIAQQMIFDKPIFGWGAGGFRILYLDRLAEFLGNPANTDFIGSALSTGGANANQVHNDYLQLAVDYGLVGLGLFLWIIILYFWFMLKQYRYLPNRISQIQWLGWIMLISTILLDSIFNFPFYIPVSGLLFWSCMGLSISHLYLYQPKNEKLEWEIKPNKIITGLAIMGLCLTVYFTWLNWNLLRGNIILKNGLRALAREQWANAELQFQRALFFDPTLGEAHKRRAVALIQLEQYSAALNSALLSFRYGTDDAERYYILADVLNHNGEPERALDILNKATTIFPNYAAAYRLQAMIYRDSLNQPYSAIAKLGKYIRSGVSADERQAAKLLIRELQRKID